ncbi:type II toxin-antitoxin system ParD family antitoxin [Allorhizobium undicola]|uniref:type II toxin-antitoxin system ParD family antitoxin n=1 Tax=Allorhizobium undicola TaxID=78527 RepID=UPI000485CC37|nr:type II toxin-antitoxin system ParD family antitoxin [Allorhizobium undicola]
MIKARQIALDEKNDRLIEQRLVSGRYASAEDVVIAGLRLLEQEECKLETLRSALSVGENSGPTRVLTREDFFRAVKSGQ